MNQGNGIEQLGRRVHLVGIGGIGMSGLAQLLRAQGVDVSGSDRALHAPENTRIFDALRAQGITLYEQNGDYAKNGALPDALIYSTAVEENNPDFLSAPHIPRVHRARALQLAQKAMAKPSRIAVCGSAGKTTTTAWLGETLHGIGLKPCVLCGGVINRFASETCVGNFVAGKGEDFVFEADESDKSLLEYDVEYCIILNIGTDHYSKEELCAVFAQMLRQTSRGAVLDYDVFKCMPPDALAHLRVQTFSVSNPNADIFLLEQKNNMVHIRTSHGVISIEMPLYGLHNICNAMSIVGLCSLRHIDYPVYPVMAQFKGVWRRFNCAGKTSSGAMVYDDYAHNPEKIESAISAAREVVAHQGGNGKLVICFQPHGFGPLQFMRHELGEKLKKLLNAQDHFMMLPVYYAGGTASFTPTSEEVVHDYRAAMPDLKINAYTDRQAAAESIRSFAKKGDVVLILGARDNSLSDWAVELAK